jgi:hypothetical protein
MDIVKSLTELLNGVREAIQQDQIDKGIRSSGKSSASLRIEVKQTQGTLYGASYFYQQKHGRKPGKFPPISAILDWIRIKGITPRDNKTTTDQLAFLFARKIAEKGTDIFTGKRPALNVEEKINQLIKEFSSKLRNDLKASMK